MGRGTTNLCELTGGPSVTTVAEFTASEKILLAAHHLEERGMSPFSAENLIVAAWQEYPRTFGLKGYDEQFPDSNRVLSCIMGEKGLTKRGWLAKMGHKMYSLTRDGRQVVRRLQGAAEPEAPETIRLPHAPGQDRKSTRLNSSHR